MNCAKVKSLLGWFYDGELSRADRQLVADHLDGCPGCAAELSALAELDRASRLLASPEPPPDLWDRLVGRLAALDARKAVWTRNVASKRRFVFAAAVFVGVLAGGVLTYRIFPKGGSGMPGPASDRPST